MLGIEPLEFINTNQARSYVSSFFENDLSDNSDDEDISILTGNDQYSYDLLLIRFNSLANRHRNDH